MIICKSNLPDQSPLNLYGYEKFKDYYVNCEMQTKDWLLKNLNPESVFVDIGANIGIHTLTAARKIKNGKIYAIEPTTTAEILRKNLEFLGIEIDKTVEIIPYALSNQNIRKLDEIFQIWGESPIVKEWEFHTLDSLVEELRISKIDVIKIDVDGYELEVLQGAIKTINTFNPKIIIEINHALNTRGVTSRAIFDFMLNLRYTRVVALDEENYLFSSDWKIGDPWPNQLSFSSYRMEFSESFTTGQLLSKKYISKNLNKSHTLKKKENYYSGNLNAWNYITLIETDIEKNIPIIVQVKGYLHQGTVSGLVVNDNLTEKISPEPFVEEKGLFEFFIICESWTNKLILRNFKSGEFAFEIYEVNTYEAISRNLSKNKLNENFSNINTFTNSSSFFNSAFPQTNLNAFEDIYLNHSHKGWLMEQSSASLLREIVRAIQPTNYLEIGTWEGFSSSIVLANSKATIFSLDVNETINFDSYSSRYVNFELSDEIKTGWLARSIDTENRFNLIIEDSTKFNWDRFSNEEFDLIFVDGGHEYKNVESDTFNIIPKLKSGGFCVWDDFNFSGEYLAVNEQDIHDFFSKNLYQLVKYFDFYFVHGTQYLIGRKK